MQSYSLIKKLGTTLKKIMTLQQQNNVESDYLLWFKKEDKYIITELGIKIETFQFLRFSLNQSNDKNIDELKCFKDKYGQFKEIKAFKGQNEPIILQIKHNNFIIIHLREKYQYIYHISLDKENNPKLVFQGKHNIKAKILVDKYLELFYVVQQNEDQFLIQIYHINDHLQKVEKLKQSQYPLNNNNFINHIDYITLYNKEILLLFRQRTAVIFYQNLSTYQIVSLQKQKKLFYYTQFLYTDTVLLMIETENNELILFQNKQNAIHNLNINFQISLNKIQMLSLESIQKIFLLDLIQDLPNLQEFCFWDSNDYEIVKLLIIGSQQTEEATSAIIYCLKYKPVFAIGIIKYLEYYCFLIDQDFKQLINSVFELIPGYLINNLTYEIAHYPNYINYLKQYNIIYSINLTDSQQIWCMLCNMTDNKCLKF
ncbi:unnamed protein product [Paramecium primaurelia]|uniref:Uncharacterized protein n=1 Tax=Paramecium primaurelia TaxID=5886 RepID=A0A8S1KA62_PARPR|nr:unnamed protein product [Paramecium primaurelia]